MVHEPRVVLQSAACVPAVLIVVLPVLMVKPVKVAEVSQVPMPTVPLFGSNAGALLFSVQCIFCLPVMFEKSF